MNHIFIIIIYIYIYVHVCVYAVYNMFHEIIQD